MLSRTEILAPAGGADAARAAVNAGADAVYLGGSMFSARAFAGNFDKEQLLHTIDYCHIHDVKVYLAINTLLKNDEIKRLPDYVEPYYREGVDGIIVQDMGVASVLTRMFPDLPLHGSTQMSVSSEYGAKLLKSMGMTRFVPSRELSLEEIRRIKDRVGIEIETFVHGAMCYCYSGRCLMSSYAGGRSGNRGRCAQPCRRSYSVDGKKPEYALSLKDMCMLGDVGKLMDAGIDSFKIEGRMKKPEYVAATVMAYREVRDAYLAGLDISELAKRHEKILLDVYNRGGFCSGYYFASNGRQMLASKRPNHNGIRVGKVVKLCQPYVDVELCESVNHLDVLEMRGKNADVELTCSASAEAGSHVRLKAKSFKSISVGDEVYRTRNNALLEQLDSMERRRVRLRAVIKAHAGEPVRLEVTTVDGGTAVSVSGEECMTAQSRPVTAGQMTEKLMKTGDTEYEFISVEADTGDDVFVRMGAVNELRRQALSEMDRALSDRYRRSGAVCEDAGTTARCGHSVLPGAAVYVSNLEQVSIVKKYKWYRTVIVDYNIRECADTLKSDGFMVITALPEIFRPSRLAELSVPVCDGVLVKNIDELGFLMKMNYNGLMVMSPGMYAYNDEALEFYRRYADRMCFMASEELTLSELKDLSDEVMIKIYGYQRVMVAAGCVRANYKGCVRDRSGQTVTRLSGEMGDSFYAVNCCEGCYNVIYNGVPTDITDRYNGLSDSFGSFYIELTIEDADEAERVILAVHDAVCSHHTDVRGARGAYTRGHYYKGID